MPKATQFLTESERLFASSKLSDKTMHGTVRITLPPMPYNDQILFELLTALEPYPDIVIDWQVGIDRLKIVASPILLKRLGYPQDLQDLAQNYPLSGLLDPKLKRIWQWQINAEHRFMPNRVVFFASDVASELQAALAGRACAYLIDSVCQPHIEQGRLVELFPDIEKQTWQLYLYRPYQTVVADRVLWVYERLKGILQRHLSGEIQTKK